MAELADLRKFEEAIDILRYRALAAVMEAEDILKPIGIKSIMPHAKNGIRQEIDRIEGMIDAVLMEAGYLNAD